ncbi:hypothetical protein WI36_24245 [Burkholderia ubonensis]|uniref:hypothetical protein n=1 Tax=Burkholderia ubonensis TaxID=101571 RepID=UPI00075B914C|nr:hypothetical protein [Burkholderia ubonensis]KUZ66879.1 hypothetical protein WI36_24245 [Burkholderia ubonensis]
MDGATLQRKVYQGYSKAAIRVGLPFAQYRPTGPNNPTQGTPLNASLLASFNAEDMKYGRANKYGKPTWYCLADGTQMQPFDYLVGADSTYFIVAMQPLLPILAVECNRTINITRPQQQTQFGQVSSYEGTTAANEVPLMHAWPASVLQGTKGEKGAVVLPGDVRDPWWAILVPSTPSVMLRSGDLIADDIGRRYIISSAELTDLGWRLTAQQGQT